jgi:hypothetical protein
VAGREGMTNAIKNVVANPKGKRSLWKPTCRRYDNIKTNVTEIRNEDANWIHATQDRETLGELL